MGRKTCVYKLYCRWIYRRTFPPCYHEGIDGEDGRRTTYPVLMHVTSVFMYMMVRCTRLTQMKFHLGSLEEMHSAWHLRMQDPKIMEPVYNVEVLVPSERMGDVISDLQGRRAIVQGMSSEKGFEKVTAKVPLAEMNKYSTALSSNHQRQGNVFNVI